MIKVPIGRGIAQQLERPQEKPVTLSNNIEFLRELMVKRRMVIETGLFATTGQGITITPADGTTFFFLKCICSNVDGTNPSDISIVNNSAARAQTIEVVNCLVDTTEESKMPIDMLVGDGVATFTCLIAATQGTTRITVYGWNENTPRIA